MARGEVKYLDFAAHKAGKPQPGPQAVQVPDELVSPPSMPLAVAAVS